jgi:hypothetical protein
MAAEPSEDRRKVIYASSARQFAAPAYSGVQGAAVRRFRSHNFEA